MRSAVALRASWLSHLPTPRVAETDELACGVVGQATVEAVTARVAQSSVEHARAGFVAGSASEEMRPNRVWACNDAFVTQVLVSGGGG